MTQSQYSSSGHRHCIQTLRRSPLLQRYPLRIPLFFVLGSVLLILMSFSTNAVIPVLAFIGVPSTLLCLSLAFVLGIVGILIGIISMIETFERHYSQQAVMFPKPKEHSYDR